MVKKVSKMVTLDKDVMEVLLPYMEENGIKFSTFIQAYLKKFCEEKGLLKED